MTTIKTKFGTASFSKTHGKGYYIISSSKEGNRGKSLHRLIYEDYHGIKIPEGMQIHHIDEDTTNNDPSNLEMVSISEHNSIHKVGNTNTLGYHHTDETKQKISAKAKERWSNPENRQKLSEIRTNKHATLIKGGFTDKGKRRFIIKFKGNLLKSSINPSKLINWFTMEYPNEIIKLSNNGGCIDG